MAMKKPSKAVKSERYPASYQQSDVEIRFANNKLYCVYSKSGELLFPDDFRRQFTHHPESSYKKDEEGAHINQCEHYAEKHPDVNVEIKPSKIEKFCVYSKKGELLYPTYHEFGKYKDSCERWIREYCAGPLDKLFEKKFLEKLTKLDASSSLDDILIVENKLLEEHERHSDHQVVFKQGNEYYCFHYVLTFCGLGIGMWNSNKNKINENTYLCRRVEPKEKTIIEFVE